MTSGPWYRLSGSKGSVNISNTVGPDWAGKDHYVGEVTDENSSVVSATPDLHNALVSCYFELMTIAPFLTGAYQKNVMAAAKKAKAALEKSERGLHE